MTTRTRHKKEGGDPAGPNNTLNTALNMVDREAGEASTCRPAPDWAALPPPALDVVARRLSAAAEAAAAASAPVAGWVRQELRLRGFEAGTPGVSGAEAGGRRPHDGVLAFAMTCRAWRRAQARLGPMRTRVGPLIEPGGKLTKLWAWANSSVVAPRSPAAGEP